MVWHVAVETTIDMGINIDKPPGVMPSIIGGISVRTRGLKYNGVQMHPICRVGRSDPGMQSIEGAYSPTVASNFWSTGIVQKGTLNNGQMKATRDMVGLPT